MDQLTFFDTKNIKYSLCSIFILNEGNFKHWILLMRKCVVTTPCMGDPDPSLLRATGTHCKGVFSWIALIYSMSEHIIKMIYPLLFSYFLGSILSSAESFTNPQICDIFVNEWRFSLKMTFKCETVLKSSDQYTCILCKVANWKQCVLWDIFISNLKKIS